MTAKRDIEPDNEQFLQVHIKKIEVIVGKQAACTDEDTMQRINFFYQKFIRSKNVWKQKQVKRVHKLVLILRHFRRPF